MKTRMGWDGEWPRGVEGEGRERSREGEGRGREKQKENSRRGKTGIGVSWKHKLNIVNL